MMLSRLAITLATALLAIPALATPSLEQIMADPDWIGPPVEQAWFSLDGGQALYTVKRAGSPVRDLHRIDLGSGIDRIVADDERYGIDSDNVQFDPARRRALFVRDGQVFLRDLGNGQLRQLTAGAERVRDARFAAGGRILVRSGSTWLAIDPASGRGGALADLRAAKDPEAIGVNDGLKQTQLDLFDTLRRIRSDREAERERNETLRGSDPTLPPTPWYLGEKTELVDSQPSPDTRWLLVTTQPQADKPADAVKMPHFVTESGTVETEDVRHRVGRPHPTGHVVELFDLRERRRVPLDLSTLPGIGDDPLADLRSRNTGKPAPERRPVTVERARWSDDGRFLAVQLHSTDNKDRWLVRVEPARGAALHVVERLSDAAWINWSFNEFDWLPGTHSLWFLSERSGHSHLYLHRADRARDTFQALTQGNWEVSSPRVDAEGRHFWFVGNQNHPTRYELYRVPVAGGLVEALTDLRGVERFALAPTADRVLVTHSSSHAPAQLSLLTVSDKQLRSLTDTRTEAYRALQWPPLEIVAVPSRHQAQPLWSKLYKPANLESDRKYPAVLFVHGAGYLQNTHWRFPQYYREQMFHHLLVERGFIVLDIDYRASAGYGRDWRTAIYRRMGHPELEDLVDGIDWLVAEHQVDPDRIGVYGGSYGGFMALMALFREPDRFVAGAALRPVTDWRQYSHGYTSNILNTPDIDPEAYRISSPIEYADALRGHLLIAHGMLDDNVFYQDSVMLAQRLIELKKENWELASYPLERHGYVHAESWLDQYRRVLKLFERTLLD